MWFFDRYSFNDVYPNSSAWSPLGYSQESVGVEEVPLAIARVSS